jgi:hypothetical protein
VQCRSDLHCSAVVVCIIDDGPLRICGLYDKKSFLALSCVSFFIYF